MDRRAGDRVDRHIGDGRAKADGRVTTTVLFFARLRELAGARSAVVDGATVADVLAAAGRTYGDEFTKLIDTCTVMVDDEVVHREQFQTHPPGRELALLPPVSGGAVDDVDDRCGSHPTGQARPLRVAVLTVSDRASAGTYQDLTGPAVVAVLGELSESLVTEVCDRKVVADDFDTIAAALVAWSDSGGVDLILTNGGTGLSPSDVTPEATSSVLDVEAPGITELMRSAGLAKTPMAALSRQVAGRRGGTVIVNLPGSQRGAVESLEAVAPILGHACALAGSGKP